MSVPTGSPQSSSWENLDPWEKAAQWHRVSPEISEKLLEIAADRAREHMARDRARATFEMEMAERQASCERELAERQASFDMKLSESKEKHSQAMDIRLWWTQLIGLIGGLLCIAGLIAVAWHYADSGNLIPGLAVFGMGSGLTAGIYGAGHLIRKEINKKQSASIDREHEHLRRDTT